MAKSYAGKKGRVWKGTISFGLVSIPVELMTAKKSPASTLKMVSEKGKPLKRIYYCSKNNKKLKSSEINRGYELEGEKIVVLSDEELEALGQERSRDINIDRFSPVDQLDPVTFENSYYVLPAKKSSAKPYLLLMETMAKKKVAGIATFVMRAKEHIVAIFPQDGILHAQNLRFADEINQFNKSAPSSDVSNSELADMCKALRKMKNDSLPIEKLEDPKVSKLQKLVNKYDVKKKKRSPKSSGNLIEIMDIIEKRIKRDRESEQLTKDDLYEKARDLSIKGRSSMNKDQLFKAIKNAQ